MNLEKSGEIMVRNLDHVVAIDWEFVGDDYRSLGPQGFTRKHELRGWVRLRAKPRRWPVSEDRDDAKRRRSGF